MVKKLILRNKKSFSNFILALILIVGFQNYSYATYNQIDNDTIGFNQYKGKVIDSKTKKALVFASLTVNGTNISTITNSQGEFVIKVPKKYSNNRITISFLGYTSKVINLQDFDKNKIVIKLETYIEELSEIKILVKDAKSLVSEMLKRKGVNYFNSPTTMTAFYRETIKKRRSYVSLSEAVIEINKQPYLSNKDDLLKLHKARKSTDYNKLDTITLKLKGGPSSTIHIDIMKNTSLFFGNDIFENYDFHFDTSTKIDDRPIYVVNFNQKSTIKDPLYYGKLYIDANTLALTSAKFQLNLDDKKEASKLFIVKKPKKASVLPTEATYQINYRVKDGKWYFSYSRIQLGFKIDYDKRLFNSVYNLTMEMAITDWKKNVNGDVIKQRERLKSSVILNDKASGFSDLEFWGEYNVIEPEKPIESAIKKIQKQLKKI